MGYRLESVEMIGRVDTLPMYRTTTKEYRALVYHRTWKITVFSEGIITPSLSTILSSTKYFDRDGSSVTYSYPTLENSTGMASGGTEGVHYLYEPAFAEFSATNGWFIETTQEITSLDKATSAGVLEKFTKIHIVGGEKYWRYQAKIPIDLEN